MYQHSSVIYHVCCYIFIIGKLSKHPSLLMFNLLDYFASKLSYTCISGCYFTSTLSTQLLYLYFFPSFLTHKHIYFLFVLFFYFCLLIYYFSHPQRLTRARHLHTCFRLACIKQICLSFPL